MTHLQALVITKSIDPRYQIGRVVPAQKIKATAVEINAMQLQSKEFSTWVAHGVKNTIEPNQPIIVTDTISHSDPRPPAPDCNLYANEQFEVATKDAIDAAGVPGIYKRLNSDSSCDFPLSFEIK